MDIVALEIIHWLTAKIAVTASLISSESNAVEYYSSVFNACLKSKSLKTNSITKNLHWNVSFILS